MNFKFLILLIFPLLFSSCSKKKELFLYDLSREASWSTNKNLKSNAVVDFNLESNIDYGSGRISTQLNIRVISNSTNKVMFNDTLEIERLVNSERKKKYYPSYVKMKTSAIGIGTITIPNDDRYSFKFTILDDTLVDRKINSLEIEALFE